MPNKLVMLSTHGTWDPIVENPALLKKDGTSLTGSTKSVEEHRVNNRLFNNFNTAIEKTYDEMQITTGDNIYIGYDGDGIQGWDHLNRTDVNTTIPVPPTILFLKFISHLVIKGIPVANIFLIQCQNDYISSFADLTKCIETEGNLKKMMFPELTEDKINKIVEVLEHYQNINIVHFDRNMNDTKYQEKIDLLKKNLISKHPVIDDEIAKFDASQNLLGLTDTKKRSYIKNIKIFQEIPSPMMPAKYNSALLYNKYRFLLTKKMSILRGNLILIPVYQYHDDSTSMIYGGIYHEQTAVLKKYNHGNTYALSSTAAWIAVLQSNTDKYYSVTNHTNDFERDILPEFTGENSIYYLPVWNTDFVVVTKKEDDIITLNIEKYIKILLKRIIVIPTTEGVPRSVTGNDDYKQPSLIKRGGSRKKTKRKPKRTKKLKPSKRKPTKRKSSKRSRVRKNKQSLKN